MVFWAQSTTEDYIKAVWLGPNPGPVVCKTLANDGRLQTPWSTLLRKPKMFHNNLIKNNNSKKRTEEQNHLTCSFIKDQILIHSLLFNLYKVLWHWNTFKVNTTSLTTGQYRSQLCIVWKWLLHWCLEEYHPWGIWYRLAQFETACFKVWKK